MANTFSPFVNDDWTQAPQPVAAASPVKALMPQDAGAPPVLAKIGMPSAPPVFADPSTPTITRQNTPIEDQVGQTAQHLKKLQYQDANPYGSANNHPGVGGKILHALSVAGNIAGDIFAPSTMELIPGTALNRRVQEGLDTSRLQDLTQQKSQDESRDALTDKTNAETRNLPQQEADQHALSGATTGNLESETDQRNNPHEEWKPVPTITGPNGEPVEMETKSGQFRFGNVSGTQPVKQPKPDSPEQQYIDEYQKLHKGATIADAERQYALDTQRPPQITPTMVMVPNPGGGFTATAVRPGQTVAPGAVTTGGMNTMNVPTSQQRNVAGQAALVHEQMPQLITQISQMGDSLGPVAGKWNEFMQGKVGMNNPKFADLRANLLMMSSAVALMHARGRLPENLREEFDQAINAPKQTPANLTAVLKRIDQWTVANMNAMGGNAAAGAGATDNGGGNGIQVLTDNGVTYHIPSDKVADFKKDHPHAR